MNIEVLKSGSTIGRRQILGVALYDDFTAANLAPLPSSIAALVSMHIPRENFKAKKGKTLVVPLADGDIMCVVLAGLGSRDEVRADDHRLAAYHIVRAAAERGASSVSIAMPEASEYQVSRAVGEAAALARYRFKKYQSPDDEDRFAAPENVALLDGNERALADGFTIGSCQCYARDLANEPGNVINPEVLEKIARDLALESGLKISVIDHEQLASRGMNALLAVGKGSAVPPRLIHLEYAPESPVASAALVGKGITFDSGGLDIKPSEAMLTMKGDKTGACVVMGAVKAAAALRLPVRIHAIIGAAENMPGGSAYRPDDVIKAYNGKTIEVNNTDAEGRLTLADALAYACEQKPDFVIDIATLTGACAVALGDTTAGLFTNDDGFAGDFLAAAATSGERFWKLPMDDENLRRKIKSSVADLINSAGRYGGAITAAMFLENFVEKGRPWIHLDIAAADFVKEPYSYYVKGATAYGMRAITSYLISRANGDIGRGL
ncbi:MAG: leucyl aminopeptidase [Synergistaceae bacterium]|jgi:leucyl aminopeptidase|nr:leucyl aminopeptidase [Synergistaceae bacterium]